MVYHHAEPHEQACQSYTESGLVPWGWMPPFSFVNFNCSKSCNFFRLFQLFRLFTFRPTTFIPQLLVIYFLIGHRSSLAIPHPINRHRYSQVFYLVVVAYIAVAIS